MSQVEARGSQNRKRSLWRKAAISDSPEGRCVGGGAPLGLQPVLADGLQAPEQDVVAQALGHGPEQPQLLLQEGAVVLLGTLLAVADADPPQLVALDPDRGADAILAGREARRGVGLPQMDDLGLADVGILPAGQQGLCDAREDGRRLQVLPVAQGLDLVEAVQLLRPFLEREQDLLQRAVGISHAASPLPCRCGRRPGSRGGAGSGRA